MQAPVNDVGLKFGKRLWTPHYLTGQILVSRDLMRSATINVDEYVRKEIALDTDYREEEAYMVGHGVGRPLGIFVASTDGIPTTRDYAGANTGTALVASTFIQAKYQLKPRYRRSPSCSWLFHRTVLGAVAALQDGDGRFLFELSREAGEPDRLCGIPVNETEFAPATMTTGLYVGVLGDHSQYWIAESLELDIQRLVETHAGTNQDAYLYRRKIDGMPTQGEAFVRIKMG